MNRTSKKREPGRKARKTAASKEEAGSGTVSLKETANLTVVRNSTRIAESLLKCALVGDMTSARLLFSLAEGVVHGNDNGTGGAKVSIASVLAAEPQWQGEVSEPLAETGSGSREPES